MAPDPIVIQRPAGRLLLLVTGAAVLVAISVWLLTGTEGGWVYPTAGGLGVVLFGSGLAVGLRRLFSREPVLRVGEQGVFDGVPGVGVGWIAWEEIEFIGVTRSLGGTYLTIQVLDGDEVLRRQPWYRRLALQWFRHLDGSHVTISSFLLSVPLRELREKVVDFIEDVADEGPAA